MVAAYLTLHTSERDEKEMDLSNNKIGITTSTGLKNASVETLEKAGLKALREHKLKVISPDGEIPDWSYE